MKTCLVTGGGGFIGSHLIESLLPKYNVICVDNISSGNMDNIELFSSNKNYRFIKHDVKKPMAVSESVDYLFHLASRASPVDFSEHPLDILLTNSIGTLNMLNLAKDKDARMVFTSTSEVYGNPEMHPQPETYWGNVNTRGPRSCYDESKRFGEAVCVAFYRKFRLDIRTARIFNTYGPRMRADDGRVIPNFMTQALANKPITVYGKGNQTRSFCFVTDMTAGLRKLMFTEGIGGDVFNIGNPNELTILELAEKIRDMAGSSSEIVFKGLPKDDPERRCPDISKARAGLGWEPGVSLEDGLKKTMDFFRG